jgi:hypothetical protein
MKSQFGSMYNLPQGNEVSKFASIFSFLISSLHYCVEGQIHKWFSLQKKLQMFLKIKMFSNQFEDFIFK